MRTDSDLVARRLINPRPVLGRSPASSSRRTSPGASAQHAAGRCPSGLSVLQGQYTVDEDIGYPGGVLHRLRISRMVLKGFRVKYDQVRECAGPQAAAILQA